MIAFLRRRLAAKLTAGYLTAALGVTLAVGFMLTRKLEGQAMSELENSLATQARLMAQALPADGIRPEDQALLQSLALRWKQASGCRITLMTLDGTVAADSDVPQKDLASVENHRTRSEMRSALLGQTGRSIRRSTTVQRPLFYVAIPLKAGDAVSGVLRLALPLTSVQRLMESVARTLIAGLGLALGGIVLVGAYVTLRVTRPLSTMAESARRFARGDWQARAPFQGSDEVAQLAKTFNEMARQIQAKVQELEASRSQVEGILQSMREGVVAVGPVGEILLINPAACQIFGLGDPTQEMGRPFHEAVRSSEILGVVREVQKTKAPVSCDLTLYAPSERHLRVQAAACACPPPPEADLCALLVLHDITDLKHLEGIRRDFVANVSHELKTPLTAIQGAVETLLGGALEDPKNNRSFALLISEEALRLGRLVDDLLTLAQVESKQPVLRPEPIALASFLKEEASRYEPLARSHQVTLTCQVEPSGLALMTDRNLLAVAVGNLLDNAVKYNRPGGSVSVRAFVRGNFCRVEVEDAGIGIPAEDLPRIFERFYRVDKARSRETGGTGLGLSIVKHAAEVLGGRVEVESRPSAGSRFSLVFPL